MRGPGLEDEYAEVAQLHSISPDQGSFDLVKKCLDRPFNIPCVQMRILPCDAQHQL
jgi:hypothetical protein